MAQDDLENDIEEFDNQEELLRKPATFLKRKRWIAIMEFKNNSCAEARERAERDARAAAGVHTDTFDEWRKTSASVGDQALRTDTSTITDFQYDLMLALRHPQDTPRPISTLQHTPTTLIYHALVSNTLRRRCAHCKKRTNYKCAICSEYWLCNTGICNVAAHNLAVSWTS